MEDLALGPPQAYRLLRGAGVRATKAEAAELADATEGWPVGLYLAALSLQEQRRSTLPPVRFTGDDRFVVDYVRSEVLGRLSRERQRFLTRTSILDRLNGSVCDAVMERSGSARTLESIEKQNLLLVPLDRQREWYRYHNLFRDVLRAELARREPEAIPELHRRAADRFEEAGMLEEAFVHAHASGGRGTGSRAAPTQWGSRTTGNGSDRDPASLARPARGGRVAGNAGLAIMAAWISALSGDPVAAEQWARPPTTCRSPVLRSSARCRSDRPRRSVHATMSRGGAEAMYRAAEVPSAKSRRPASSARPPSVTSGIATMIRGDDDGADALFAEASEAGQRIGGMPAASLAFAERSLIATSRGDKDAAEEFARARRVVVQDAHLDEHITTGPVHAAAARVALRAGDHEQARADLTAAHRLRPILTWGFPTISVQTRLELARVHMGLSDVEGARTLLAEVDEILAHRPDLGTLTTQAVELRTHVGSVRSDAHPGPPP